MHKSVIAEKRVSDTGLTKEELQRYSRHLIMPEVTAEGQKRLKAARVLCIGAGGLGSPAALYLAAAGVGKLGLVDFDRVDLTNLQRQILHGTKDIGRSKLESARDRLAISTQVSKLSCTSADCPARTRRELWPITTWS